ncbi:hypothetical protein ACOSP7_026459 [Xanthoceras sorbifolium]
MALINLTVIRMALILIPLVIRMANLVLENGDVGRWKGFNSRGIPVSSLVRVVDENVVDDLRNKNHTPLVGLISVSNEIVTTGALVAFARTES